MQPIQSNDPWFQFDPVPRYFMMPSGESQKFTAWAKPYITSGGILSIWSYMTSWEQARGFGNLSSEVYKEIGPYRTAIQAYLDKQVQYELSRSGLTLSDSLRYVLSGVAVSIDAQTTFYPSGFADAYFDRISNDFSTSYLNLFVATPLYKGPGRYEFLCKDRRLINVVVDHKRVTDVYYKLVSKSSGKSLAVKDASADGGAPIVQVSATAAPHALWRLESAPDGHVELVARHSSQSINVPGSSLNDNVQVLQWYVEPNANSKWKLVSVGSGWYQIVARHSGKCLAVANSSTDDGAAIVQVPVSNTDNTMWKFAPI